MKEPLVISFPVITRQFQGESRRMILLRRADLPDARGPTYQPTKCQATAATPINGNMAIFSFTMEIAEWEKACVTPAHFTEVDTLRGPSAALVKPDGSPLAS